jgi:hypothetical protein
LLFQLGAKKGGGMGAQKVKKDFAEIEREAELADQVKFEAFESRDRYYDFFKHFR